MKYRAVSVWFPFSDVVSPNRDGRSQVDSIVRGLNVILADGVDPTRCVEFVHVLDISGTIEWLPEFEGGCGIVQNTDFQTFNSWVEKSKVTA